MNGRRAIVGLCMTCALLVSAFAASGAQAAATAHKCMESEAGTGEKFSDAHCQTKNAGGKFRHVELKAPQALTGTTGTKFEGKQKLRMTTNAINIELQTSSMTVEGTLETNNGTKVAGTGRIIYTGVTVIAPNAMCKVYEDNEAIQARRGKSSPRR